MSILPTTFISTFKDVLLIDSFSAMGGEGLTCAFVFDRPRGVGIIVDGAGRICDVDDADWRELQRVVSDAKETILQGGSGNWSGPMGGVSCTPHTYYDLGPADEPGGFAVVRSTGHTVHWDASKHVEHTYPGVHQRVAEKPSSIVELGKAIWAIQRKLLPHEIDHQRLVRSSGDAREMLDAIEGMCSLAKSAKSVRWIRPS
ncbi:hypothetical protein FB451DRAFT_1372038 [Mycena latifolia]|nr:hypothetical protein FB451DRAFT_1372038 [Mycena latifolia]